jgi:hypothetical protein
MTEFSYHPPPADRRGWLPPPPPDYQEAHGKPPGGGNGHDKDADGGHYASSPALLIGEAAEDETSIPRRVYVVPGYIPRGVVLELIGPASAGKSQLLIAWGVALALGRPLGGFKSERPMRVMLFQRRRRYPRAATPGGCDPAYVRRDKGGPGRAVVAGEPVANRDASGARSGDADAAAH